MIKLNFPIINCFKVEYRKCFPGVLQNIKQRNFGTAPSPSEKYDLVVIGGGIVGTASAREVLLRHPNLKVAIVEKEERLAVHQSGHNSGVIHAGIYYKPGSLKAKLCVEGLHLSYKYLDEHKIPYKKCGKLIVATDDKEVKQLDELFDRGTKNNVPGMKMLNTLAEIQTIEPFCEGVKAIHSPETGIVDWGLVTEHYGEDFKKAGGEIKFCFRVVNFCPNADSMYPVRVKPENGTAIAARYVLGCAGLQSDLLAELSGCAKEPRIVPFRGEYLLLNESKVHMVKGNIYPVPDPTFPFLGVHFTPRMDGSVWLGPNAVLAFQREGYKWTDIDLKELFDAVSFPGFRTLAMKYVTAGMKETMRSLIPSMQVKHLKKFIKCVGVEDVCPGPAGVRAQALDAKGGLVDDFVFELGKGSIGQNILHCRNAPSPGATSSLAIAKMIADKLQEEFKFK